MKNEPLHTWLWATCISFCLGLGAVASMATGLALPVKLVALVILCLILSAVISGLCHLRYGGLISLGFGSILFLNPDFWTELKTLGAALCMRLRLGYGIPTPEFLQDELSKQVLSALCMIGGLIMVVTARAVQKQKSCIPPVLLSLLPLACCIIVVDTVPSSPCLFLWGFGLVLLLMTQGTRQQCTVRGNRLTGLLALPVALVLLLIFWLVPRDATDRWSIADLPNQILNHFSGNSDTGPIAPIPQSPPKVDLSALGERRQKQTPVMEVTADFTGPLYLRSRDYDEYTGTGWNSSPNRTEELYGFDPQWHLKDGTVEITLRQPQDIYYLPAITQQVQLVTGGQVSNPDRKTTYQFDHCSMHSDWQDTWEDSLVSTVNPRYLKLPDSTLQGAWAYLHGQEVFQATSLYDTPAPVMAEQIRLCLREHVPYNLSTPNMPESETDLALWFLNDAQTGYCVHYATTAVVLLRACGIPARYVEGYAIHVQKGSTATVRELHAHAWAEYYVNGVGWLVLEATPSGGTTPEEPVTTQPTQIQPTTTAPTAPTTPTTKPTALETPQSKPDKTPPAWVMPLLRTIGWTAAALIFLWGQYHLRRTLFRRSLRRGNPNHRALRIHRRLCRLSKWTGEPVPAELTQLAQKARFSPHTLTKGELSRFQGHLKLMESAVSLLPLYKRLPAKWLFARY